MRKQHFHNHAPGPYLKSLKINHCGLRTINVMKFAALLKSYLKSLDFVVICFLMPSLHVKFQNYFILRRRPSEIILFQRVKTCLKLFQNYFTALLQLMNIFQHVRCR